jgi:hypothetical protein
MEEENKERVDDDEEDEERMDEERVDEEEEDEKRMNEEEENEEEDEKERFDEEYLMRRNRSFSFVLPARCFYSVKNRITYSIFSKELKPM